MKIKNMKIGQTITAGNDLSLNEAKKLVDRVLTNDMAYALEESGMSSKSDMEYALTDQAEGALPGNKKLSDKDRKAFDKYVKEKVKFFTR